MKPSLPHARTRVPAWVAAWRRAGRIVLLLDYDGTLSPIVDRPELAVPAPGARESLERLLQRGGVDAAIVSGRSLADARQRLGITGIVYAGNHGMEIEGPGMHQVHPAAAAARPLLDRVAADIGSPLQQIAGALVEDKGLTLSIHYRLVAPERSERVREVVAAAVARHQGLRLTEGKMVLEVRPHVEWDKGRAIEFLLRSFAPPPAAPVLYFGDDTTDEDAFRALRSWREGEGEGIIVSDSPSTTTAAGAFVHEPAEVVELLRALSLA